MVKSSSEQVARRAYELFLARGAGHGRDLDDWLEAERQLTEQAPNGRNKGTGAPARRGRTISLTASAKRR
jgi:hypothetical protein